MLKARLLVIVLGLLLLSLSGVLAQDGTSPGQVIIVNSLDQLNQRSIPVHAGESVTYRLAQCDDPAAPCSVTVRASIRSTGAPFSSFHTMSSSATLICGKDIRNGFGVVVASLQESQPTTFYNEFGKSPFSWDNLPTSTRSAVFPYVWGGQWVSIILPDVGVQSGVGYSRTDSTLYYLGTPTAVYVNIRFLTYGSAWTCE